MAILIVGATGFVGQATALRLHPGKQQVRGLVRGGATHPKANGLQAAGVTVVEGDLTRPETLATACAGIETIVCTATSMPTAANDGLRQVDLEGTLALIEAAERAGVQRFVYTSYSGNLRFASPLETAKRTCEDRLLKGRMQTIILRPSYFMEMWLGPHLGFDPEKGSARIYGSGETKVSYISAFDVADFAVSAAVKKIDKKHAILEMGGPDALSQLEAVGVFERALGKKITVEHVPAEALHQQHQSATDPLQKTFAALMLGYAQGDVIQGAKETAAQYGVQLRSLAEYAASLRMRSAGVA
ncbi:MAG TPA: NmrA family NAD(P)-binding protein [Terriglobales bacterium]|nr:NmrA family NAD(P)-binding protein [Terriglobales bacterium]